MSFFKSLKLIKSYRANPIGFFQQLQRENGHRSVVTILGRKLIFLSHPRDVLHVLKEHHSLYSKGRTYVAMKIFIGNGLITSDGDFWRRQHRQVRPMMNPKSVANMAPKIFETTSEFIPMLLRDKKCDAFHEMNRLTWRIVLNTLFTEKASEEMDEWLKDILYIMDGIMMRTRSAFPLPLWIPTHENRMMKKCIKKFDDFVYKLIDERRKTHGKKDLLQLLIETRDEDDAKSMGDKEVKDEILTFLMAGHETITNTMTWTLLTLAKHPEYKRFLEEEADLFFADQDFEKLNAMPWHTAIIDEVMRLWPPVWAFMRKAEKDDAIDSLLISRKTNVVLSPFLTHRSPDLWERPNDFFPERFLPGERKKIPVGAFYPFGLGPRACIGAYFAGMEAKIILASIVKNFDWSLCQNEEQTYHAGLTLRPTNNIVMNFRKRHV